jgi:hypothetical protein
MRRIPMECQVREEFDTEGEAIAFTEGVETAINLLDSDHLTIDRFVEGDKWVVEVDFVA